MVKYILKANLLLRPKKKTLFTKIKFRNISSEWSFVITTFIYYSVDRKKKYIIRYNFYLIY